MAHSIHLWAAISGILARPRQVHTCRERLRQSTERDEHLSQLGWYAVWSTFHRVALPASSWIKLVLIITCGRPQEVMEGSEIEDPSRFRGF